MLDIFSELNWVGIVVGAVLVYALGAGGTRPACSESSCWTINLC